MEETVESKTLEQLMKDPVWPAAVSTAAVALIPKEANQTPTPLDLRPITVTVPLVPACGQGHASLMSSGGAKLGCPTLWREAFQKIASQECVWTLLLAMEGEEEGVATAAIDTSKFLDMIVWEMVFPMMGKMRVPDRCAEAPGQLPLPFETVFSSW